MQYGLCPLSIVPVRAEANDRAELVTQLIYGDIFEIISNQKNWIQIRIAFDTYEGWIDIKQAFPIEENDFNELKKRFFNCSQDLIEFVETANNQLIPIPIGSNIAATNILQHQFEGQVFNSKTFQKEKIAEIALLYLNAPYLWGGKTPFGIDCSGFTQMVYRICGYALQRDASQQAKQGEALSFIEESEPGDLAFFDNEEGSIIHVGIVLGDNYIIHAHGKVRIDRLDHTGIFNTENKTYSHNLRVIKSI
ncbi:C40 family peptidase [Psychroflexus planctonicus]|uniref:Hydrolase Nlp/P60 n=1 Tax=Psychroflexus planctonicus TaxID=1526575 RepID=A0ABQ1SDK3_9FLAO|nr:C40 family peptidase [Psychroflexus planctonicus]GGE31253.1 hydrolase Nlp/P60 [Psychroflexus planctonicus]